MSALQLAWRRSWRTLVAYAVFTAWGLGCVAVSIMLTVGAKGLPAEASSALVTLVGLGIAAAVGHVVGNVLAIARLRLWVVAVVAVIVAASTAGCMTALGGFAGFFAIFALAAAGGWLGVASRMEVLGAWLPLTYAVGASVLWMNTHARVSVWLTGAKFAVWDAITFAFLAGAVLFFLVFLAARHALALTLWRDAARPGYVLDDDTSDDIARAGKGTGTVVVGMSLFLVAATAVLSPFLFQSDREQLPEDAGGPTTTAGSYSTHYSAGAPTPIHIGGGTVVIDDDYFAHAVSVGSLDTRGTGVGWGGGGLGSGGHGGSHGGHHGSSHGQPAHAPPKLHQAPPPRPQPPQPSPDPPRLADDGCEHLSGTALLSCMTKLKTKAPGSSSSSSAASSGGAGGGGAGGAGVAVASTGPIPVYSGDARVIVDPTKYVHTHSHAHARVGGAHGGGVGSHAGAASGGDAGGDAGDAGGGVDDKPPEPPPPVQWKDGASSASTAPDPGTPIPDGGEDHDGAAHALARPDLDRAAEQGAHAAWKGVVLVALVVMLFAAALALAIFFRPIRRKILLRHLELPLWGTTPTRRIENLWLRALVALDDVGIRENAGDTPEKFAVRATGILTQEFGAVPSGLDAAARIIERIEYAGRGLSPDEETKMRAAVLAFLAYVDNHLGFAKKASLAWAPVRTR